MVYCTKCGNKLKEENKFCTKCGTPTSLYIEERKKENKEKLEENKEKLLLGIGTLLIIIASVIFAYANWNDMTGIIKVLFLFVDSFLFLAISLFSKRVNEKLPYKFLWFIGISFIPIILNLIAYDKLLGEYLSYDGAGIYVYLSISSFICAIVYYLSNKLLKSNLFLYFTYAFIYLTIVFSLYILKLDTIFKFDLILPILSIINLSICLFYNNLKNDIVKKTINIFMSILCIVLSIIGCLYSFNSENMYILVGIVSIFNILSLITLIFKKEKNFIVYVYPFILFSILNTASSCIFANYSNVMVFVIILGSILFNYIINLKDDKILNIISFILMVIYTTFTTLFTDISYLTTTIVSAILIINYIFSIKINSDESQLYISKIALPILILSFIYNIVHIFVNMQSEIIYLIVSVICYTISIILYQKKKDIFTKNSFEITSYIYLALSTIIILFTDSKEISFILNELVWLYYFVFNSIYKKDKGLNITLLILLILNFVVCSAKFSISISYSLIFAAIITTILDFINRKFNKGSYYIYASMCTTALAALYDFNNLTIIGICLLILTYIATYYLLINKHNLHFTYKYLFTLIGFIIINGMFHYFISDITLANLLVVLTYIVIITSMYLLRVDEDRKIFSYYIVIALGFFSLIDSINYLQEHSITLYIIIAVSLILIYFEKVFSLKENEKVIIEISLLSFIHFITLFDVVLINFVLAAFYIFYGFYKKRGSYTILGTALLIVSLFINIMKIARNITVTYVLLVIGLTMLGYVFYIEAKKNKKK